MLGVLGLVGWMVADSRRVSLEQAGLDSGNLLALLDEDIRQSIDTYDIALQAVVSVLDRQPHLSGDDRTRELVALARAATAAYPGRMTVLDDSGAVVLSSDASADRESWLAGTPAFAFHRDQRWNGPHISGPFRDPDGGTWVLLISRRLEKPGSGFAGVVIGTLDLGVIRNLFYSISLGADDGIALWDFSHNLVMARPYVDREIGARPPDLGLFDHLDRVLQGSYEVSAPDGGEPRLVSYRQVGEFPLVLLAHRTKSSVLAEWRRRAIIATLGAVTLTLVALLLGGASALEIRRRARAEREVAAAQGIAEAASLAKSRFLAVMSHELRSPLNAVIGFSDLIAREGAGPIGDRRYVSYAEDIRSSATHLLDLITDVLDHAKAEAGHLELTEEPVDLDQVVDFSVRMLRPRAVERGVNIAVEPGGLAVMGDERRLRQIMINLLTNAVKFTPSGGRVTVTSRLEHDGGIAIEIADTGIGIAAEDLDRIFEPFQQVGSAGAGQDGTGLGLPLTRWLVELHGGRITVSSTLGVGTTLVIHLPKSRTHYPV